MVPQSLVPKAAYAFDIMATVEVMAAKLFGPPGRKVRDGVPAELRSVLEDMPDLLLDFECRVSCELSVSSLSS